MHEKGKENQHGVTIKRSLSFTTFYKRIGPSLLLFC